MAGYNEAILRAEGRDNLVPEPAVAQIIQEVPQTSTVLARARTVRMSAKTSRQPILSALPEAYFVSGDTGLKQTTAAEWGNLEMVAEEIAVIVPVPDAYFADASIDIWAELRPLIVEAFAKKIDAATLFGTDKPSTWGPAVVPHATAAGNVVAAGTNDDLAADVAAIAGKVATDGFAVNGFISAPGFNWQLVGMRTGQGAPLYSPSVTVGQPSTLYGLPLNEQRTGAYNTDAATLIAGDWSKAVVGLRQDMTFEMFREGVISDASGKIILNLMQQDTKAMRVVMRLGWQIANPLTRVGTGVKSPFGVLTPAAPAV